MAGTVTVELFRSFFPLKPKRGYKREVHEKSLHEKHLRLTTQGEGERITSKILPEQSVKKGTVRAEQYVQSVFFFIIIICEYNELFTIAITAVITGQREQIIFFQKKISNNIIKLDTSHPRPNQLQNVRLSTKIAKLC